MVLEVSSQGACLTNLLKMESMYIPLTGEDLERVKENQEKLEQKLSQKITGASLIKSSKKEDIQKIHPSLYLECHLED